MADRAVFVDRDNTLIEDPGYLNDPAQVRLLPGVDLALRSLIQSEYKIVVVTNQSGVARGLFTEHTLNDIHEEIQRQLRGKKLHVDAFYYCPYHPEGSVPEYTRESDLRKPEPGMLLKAAEELDIDLETSWMVGDSARDIVAGKRAGCRTVRLLPRKPDPVQAARERDDPESQADYTVRNFVHAARVILRADAGVGVETDTMDAPGMRLARPTVTGRDVAGSAGSPEKDTPAPVPSILPPRAVESEPSVPEDTPDYQILQGIMHEVLRVRRHMTEARFSLTKMFAGLAQMLAVVAIALTFWLAPGWASGADKIELATVWGLLAVALQVLALTLYVMSRHK